MWNNTNGSRQIESTQHIGTILKIPSLDIDKLITLSKIYDKLYCSYVIAMMSGVLQYGNVMYVQYFWKRSWLKKQMDQLEESPDNDSIYQYVNAWTARYVLISAYYAFCADRKESGNSTKNWIQFSNKLSSKNIELMNWIRQLSVRHSKGELGYSKYRYAVGNRIIPMDRYRQIEKDVFSKHKIKLPKMDRYEIDFTGYKQLKYAKRINSFQLVIREVKHELQTAARPGLQYNVYCNFSAVLSEDTPNPLYTENPQELTDDSDIVRIEEFRPGRTTFFKLVPIPGGAYEQYIDKREAKRNEA